MNIAKYLDFANHHPDATPEQIEKLCQNVIKFGFHSAFVNPCYISLAKEFLEDKFPVGTVISFPIGQDTRDGKVLAAIETTRKGADELDVMMNVGMFKAGKYKEVLEEMRAVNAAAKEIRRNVIVKFIIETGFLTEEEIKKASQLVFKSGADFVKTCSERSKFKRCEVNSGSGWRENQNQGCRGN
jgi:deoxyribose-phosphate aldolase